MGVLTGIAIYFTIWWVTLFAVLPIGIKHDHDAQSQKSKNTAAGAPLNPDLKKKVIINTVLAAVIWLIIYGLVHSGWFDFFHVAEDWAREDGLIE